MGGAACDGTRLEEKSMFPKDLVVFLEQEPDRGARLAFAAGLAKRWQAHLIGTFVAPPLDLDPHVAYAVGDALVELLGAYRASVAQEEAQARGEFEALTQRRSFTAEWRLSDNEPGEALMLHARHASLAVLGPPARQRTRPTTLGTSERLLFASGRPCVLVPPGWRSDEPAARRIVIGWNGSAQATRAIASALPLLAEADTVYLVIAPDARPQGAWGADPGVDMAAHLSRHGVPVVVDVCEGEHAGPLLLRRSRMLDADLLVMGAMGRPRVSGLLFGDATHAVLDEVALPLLVCT